MPSSRIDADAIVHLLLQLRERVGEQDLAVLRIHANDDPVDWSTFPPPSCSLPGAEIGQVSDRRYTLTDGKGLHLQGFSGQIIDAHIDDVDACTLPVEHAAQQTNAVEFSLLASLGTMLITYLATRSARATFAVGAVAAGVGAYVGANTPKQKRRVFLLADILATAGAR